MNTQLLAKWDTYKEDLLNPSNYTESPTIVFSATCAGTYNEKPTSIRDSFLKFNTGYTRSATFETISVACTESLLVDESICNFYHDSQIDSVLPNLGATGQFVSVPMVNCFN